MNLLRDIPGFEGRYAVTSDGRVWSYPRPRCRGRWLRAHPSPRGYLRIDLWTNNKPKASMIHRLVALTWIPNPKGLPSINHLDGDKLNNKAENLAWCTESENTKHAWATGLRTVTDKSRAASRRTIQIARQFRGR